LFLNLDTKNKILIVVFQLAILSISSFQLNATGSQNNSNIGGNNSDFFPNYEKKSVLINGFKVSLAIASNDELRIKGLSGSEKLNENEGMLFLFDKPSKEGFWMNEMKYAIDIIWLDSNSSVVHIEKNLEPCKIFLGCPVYDPQVDSLYVIELSTGFVDRHSIKNGTIIDLN
jgi:uncharacterized membrane protein (UPF0127 family)